MQGDSYQELERYIDSLENNKEEHLVRILRKAQEIHNCIPKEVQIFIHRKTGIPLSTIYGVMTFYPFFTLSIQEGKAKAEVLINSSEKQEKLLLKYCKEIDPENIESYISVGGYQGLKKALTMTNLQILDEVEISRLRGRGGAGFPAWKKWDSVYKQDSEEKYIVCNGNEGEAYAFKDFYLLENNPHSVIEGIIIAGYTVKASKGFIYVRSDYDTLLNRLDKALKDARAKNYLGERIMGSSFSFDIEVRYGAGAYVCGEESALIESLQGKRGEPVQRPPYIFQEGYRGKPTLLNNVETLVNIPHIIFRGGNWFSRIGTKNSTGTKIVTLMGNINNPGIAEVSMGITIRELIEDIGGGLKSGGKIKAIQSGGPSGLFITEKNFDQKVELDTMVNKDSYVGFNGIKVLEESDGIIKAVQEALEFLMDSSCGKCTPCRIGTKRIHELLTKLLEGRGTIGDVQLIREVCQALKNGAICGLGKSVPIPILSAMEEFWDEFETKILENHHPEKEYENYRFYDINDSCIGCGACALVCPVSCISGRMREKYAIDHSRCIKCNKCYEVCNFNAVERS